MPSVLPEYDERFVARLRKQDEKAFNRLVLDYQQRVYSFVLRMLGSPEEARDVAQDVFVSVFMALPRFRGDARVSTWIFRIATNHVRNRVKYLARRAAGRKQELSEVVEREDFGGDLVSRPDRPDRALEGVQLEEFLRVQIAALDPEQRELLVLRDVQELSYQEIQDITGLPEGTVKSRIHRARLTLKEKVDAFLASGQTTAGKPARVRS
jgi:RNA polymerase sigma-70 factor (ECF subfamily)